MTNPPTAPKDMISDLILDLSRRGHGSYVLLAVAQLEHALEELICEQMPKLSNTTRDKLFRRQAGLSHFSTKIDVAHAMDLIPDDIKRDLHVLRDIRNEFAHPKKEIHFHLDDVIEMMQKFKNFDDKMDRFAFISKKVNEIWSAINKRMESGMMVKALREYAKRHPASPGKTS